MIYEELTGGIIYMSELMLCNLGSFLTYLNVQFIHITERHIFH